jgi:hypothetical protein
VFLGAVEKAEGGSGRAKSTFDANVIAHPVGRRISGTVQEIKVSSRWVSREKRHIVDIAEEDLT